MDEIRDKEKKEIAYFFIGLGILFIWAIALFVEVLILRNEAYITPVLGILVPFIVTYFIMKAEGDHDYYPYMVIAPRVEYVKENKEDEIVKRKQREKMFNNNYEMYKNAYESINQIKEM